MATRFKTKDAARKGNARGTPGHAAGQRTTSSPWRYGYSAAASTTTGGTTKHRKTLPLLCREAHPLRLRRGEDRRRAQHAEDPGPPDRRNLLHLYRRDGGTDRRRYQRGEGGFVPAGAGRRNMDRGQGPAVFLLRAGAGAAKSCVQGAWMCRRRRRCGEKSGTTETWKCTGTGSALA